MNNINVSDEDLIMNENRSILFEVFNFFEKCLDAFSTIQKNNCDKPFSKDSFFRLINSSFDARLVMNKFLEKYKSLEENIIYEEEIKRNQDKSNGLKQIDPLIMTTKFRTKNKNMKNFENSIINTQIKLEENLNKTASIQNIKDNDLRKVIKKSLKRSYPYLLKTLNSVDLSKLFN